MFVTARKHAGMLVVLTLLLCGIWQIGLGTYIQAKAILAQILLEMAWSESHRTSKEVKPWPWADTWPVGRLTVPGLNISRIVLAGASGSSLAFGPGHLFGTALPGQDGNIVIAGHRDSHFRFLQDLKQGEKLILQTPDSKQLEYTVRTITIGRYDEVHYLQDNGENRLTLITCYPFDAIVPGGPLRYIITAGIPPDINNDMIL